MKALHFQRLIVSAILITSCAIGCDEPEPVDETTSASATGAGGGRECFWGGGGGGENFPACPERFTSELTGTIDGVPYDTKNSGETARWSFPPRPPYSVKLTLAESGLLNVSWDLPYVCCQWMRVTGSILLPGEQSARAVSPDSQMITTCSDSRILYRLIIDGGYLEGCSH